MMGQKGITFEKTEWKVCQRNKVKIIEFYFYREGKRYGGAIRANIAKEPFFMDELKKEYVKLFTKLFLQE